MFLKTSHSHLSSKHAQLSPPTEHCGSIIISAIQSAFVLNHPKIDINQDCTKL